MKKYISLLLAASLVIIGIPLRVSATEITDNVQEETEAAGQQLTVSEQSDLSKLRIQIDNVNAYEGMNQSYTNGYTPTIENGKVHIVLPLKITGDVDGAILVKPELGSIEDSPFCVLNYEKSVEKQSVSVGNKTVEVYLADFEITLTENRINGVYPVNFKVKALDKEKKEVDFEYCVFVTIGDGRNREEVPTAVPKLIVSSTRANTEMVTAGDTLVVSVDIKNTSKIKKVQNITITATTEATGLYIENDTNTFYYSSLGTEKTLIQELRIRTTKDMEQGRYNINLEIAYEDGEATAFTVAGIVPIDIVQEAKVELDDVWIDKNVYAGDTIALPIKVINKGRAGVYNVSCELTGFGLFPDGSAYFGSMESGTEQMKDMNVFIGSLDMSDGYSGEDKYGYTQGIIVLTYEDSNGKEYREEYNVETVIKAAPVPVEEKTETVSEWWISITIVLILVLILSGYYWWKQKKKKRLYEE